MPTLREVGQMAADLYYQDYKSDDQFFDLEHFFFLLGSEYVKMIKAEATANKKENKVFTGYSYIEISPYWVKNTTIDVKADNGRAKISLPEPVFQFDYDAVGSAIQDIYGVDCGKTTDCSEIIRIPYTDRWMACAMPPNGKIYYYLLGNDVHFINVHCNLQKVEITYVPGAECLSP
ncbi:MAG TPA: hypothetical protein VFS31_12750, partial [Chitinophagaceae bacterium]|nr:hypothetical protein [Chitinophagaceae bacterium]